MLTALRMKEIMFRNKYLLRDSLLFTIEATELPMCLLTAKKTIFRTKCLCVFPIDFPGRQNVYREGHHLPSRFMKPFALIHTIDLRVATVIFLLLVS